MPEPEFSYETSVAPYASSYFKRVDSNPYLSSARKADLSNRLLESVETARAITDKKEDRAIERELMRTRLSANRIALDDALYESQLKRDAIEQAPVIDNEFEKILAEASTKEEATARISQLAMRNANTFAQSPVLAAKYRFALRSVEPDAPALTPYQELTLRQSVSRDARSEERYAKDQADKAAKEKRDLEKEDRERFDRALNVEFAEDDFIPVAGQKKPPAKFKSPAHRERLLDLAAERDPENLDAYDALDDENLFRKISNLRRKSLQSNTQKAEPAKKPFSFD